MKYLIILALLAAPLLAPAQAPTTTETPLKPLPDYMYITPDMTRKQVDSIIAALKPYDLSLEFDTLEFDENNKIKKINGSLYAKDEYFLVSSGNFKGMTIVNRGGQSYAVVMGLFYPKKK